MKIIAVRHMNLVLNITQGLAKLSTNNVSAWENVCWEVLRSFSAGGKKLRV